MLAYLASVKESGLWRAGLPPLHWVVSLLWYGGGAFFFPMKMKTSRPSMVVREQRCLPFCVCSFSTSFLDHIMRQHVVI